jgi:hypothetical protein
VKITPPSIEAQHHPPWSSFGKFALQESALSLSANNFRNGKIGIKEADGMEIEYFGKFLR